MYSNYSSTSGQSSGYGSAYLDQNVRNRPKPKYSSGARAYPDRSHGANDASGGNSGSGFDSTMSAIPSLDANDRTGGLNSTVNGGRSLFGYPNDSNARGGVQSRSEEKSNGGAVDYGSIRVPQIGKGGSTGAGGPYGSMNSPRGGNPGGVSGPGASAAGGGTGAGNGGNGRSDSASMSRRNRSATRQSGGGRRTRGYGDGPDGNGAGGMSVEGPVLPQISGMAGQASPGGFGTTQSILSTPSGHGTGGPGSLLGHGAGTTPGGMGGSGGGIAMHQQQQQQRRLQQQQQQHHPGAAQQQQQAAHHAPSAPPVSNTTTTTGPSGTTLSITSEEHNTAAVTSIKGLKPGNPNWINQDNFFVVERFDNKDVSFYCVLDGHGENGHLVSRRCRENFPHHIKATNIDMRRAFGLMQNDLLSCEFDVRCSGATCALAMVSGGRLAVSNCGDSRAVLGRRNPNGSVAAHALTYDHKPDKPEERRRILSCGGHLGCRQVVVNQPGKGPVSVPVGPCRVWYQHCGETLGLAMSRSLGDSVVHRCGVSAEPETLEHTIDEYDEFMIIATDGVWDVLDNNQAVQMVANFSSKSPAWSPMEASASICKFARGRWEKLSPMVDDITCIVVKLRR